MKVLIILGLIFIVSINGHEEDVHTVQYTSENFAQEVKKKSHFVMFYAPWCGHCKRLGPTWEELAEMLNNDSDVTIAKVDCTTDGDVCNDNDVTGYPTLKFFKIGEKEGIKFKGTRDLPSLTTFINEHISLRDDNEGKMADNIGHLVELNEDSFEKHVAEGKHFVKFYAPWCGHCQKLAPTWEQLAKALEHDETVRISKIDCTDNKGICNQFDIKGYPTLLWVEDGKKVDRYQGQRNLEDLQEYVTKMVGSEDKLPIDEEDKQDDISKVITLTGEDFNEGIEKGVAFVKFFAPWCGHCKRLAPTWEELGKKFFNNADVSIVKIDCTLEVNKQLCSTEEVEGFPSIFLYKNGKKISEYNGNRSLQDLKDFVEHHLSSSHDEL